MPPQVFAGVYVRDLAQAQAWYEQVFGAEPSFHPNDEEAVWELAEGRFVYIQQDAQHAGHSLNTLFVDDIQGTVFAIRSRGLEPTEDETYSNGVRKVAYRDPDGNELGFGGHT